MADRAQLHLITDRKRSPGDLVAAVRRALQGGVDWVQVREKTAPAADVYVLAREVSGICRAAGAGLLINDRIDVALAVGAAGVHLARKSLPPEVARGLLASGQLLGCSVHSLEEAVGAVRAGADYVTFGNVFATGSHSGFPPKGLATLERVVEVVEVPVLAVGGITADNLPGVLATGCAGVAVIGAILAAPDPAEAAAAFRIVLDWSPTRPRYALPHRNVAVAGDGP
jgi:thiamine-phosphate pyrophosphorylase